MKSPTLTSLLVLIPILMIDAVIELSFICYIVAFLHGRATGTFSVDYPLGQTFKIQGHPSNLLKNQGHTSNGSAGTALVLVGIGGLMVIWLQKRGARIVSSQTQSCGRDSHQEDRQPVSIHAFHFLGPPHHPKCATHPQHPYLHLRRDKEPRQPNDKFNRRSRARCSCQVSSRAMDT